MELGFDTIGNATMIAYDGGPKLITDPWITESAYFGSWGHSHEIPTEQLDAIRAAPFVWFSHGHPDHLNADSLPLFRGREILLGDHCGGRMRADLEQQGFRVSILPTAEWRTISDRIRVMCLPDYNQDSVLLIAIGDQLLINFNDCAARAWGRFIRQQARKFERSYMLRGLAYGDANMINFFDEQGARLTPPQARMRDAHAPLGPQVTKLMRSYGTTFFVPFSMTHRYQRADSVWANECTTELDVFGIDLELSPSALLPTFVRCDFARDQVAALPQIESAPVVHTPETYGDRWSDELEDNDRSAAREYFQSIEHLGTFLDYVNLRVGGRDNVIALPTRRGRSFERGATFEAPRHSLMQAIQYRVFDDLLIGNFMKTTLHGNWPRSRLYPDFTPYVTKYADNGNARTATELRSYFEHYHRAVGSFDFLRHRVLAEASNVIRAAVSAESGLYQRCKGLYNQLNRWW